MGEWENAESAGKVEPLHCLGWQAGIHLQWSLHNKRGRSSTREGRIKEDEKDNKWTCSDSPCSGKAHGLHYACQNQGVDILGTTEINNRVSFKRESIAESREQREAADPAMMADTMKMERQARRTIRRP